MSLSKKFMLLWWRKLTLKLHGFCHFTCEIPIVPILSATGCKTFFVILTPYFYEPLKLPANLHPDLKLPDITNGMLSLTQKL
jgi:hypothetical protein